ncbi:MAG: hypothetical protein UZ18_ATM001002520 [Armatimonadetes bacterium OLB18]|nr:MAG: hypothetical protein UZ18_ATM001002520 [Armatimonadetes bacterium OLB18]
MGDHAKPPPNHRPIGPVQAAVPSKVEEHQSGIDEQVGREVSPELVLDVLVVVETFFDLGGPLAVFGFRLLDGFGGDSRFGGRGEELFPRHRS